jgi:uncharacterized protein (TIGR03435 family)
MKPCALLVLCCLAFAQQPAKLAFEVVSIKPSELQAMNQLRMTRSSDPGRARFGAFSLKDYIRIAYRVKDFQVQGPDWMDNVRFDVEGKFPEGATEDQVPDMLQAMLADRFKLSIHRETKEHAVFALVAGKGGPKLSATAAAPPQSDGGPSAGRGGLPRGAMRVEVDDQGAHLKSNGVTLAGLTELLSRFSERPVVDMSGIEGQYDFDLLLSMDAIRAGRGGAVMAHGPAPSGDGPPSPAGAASEGVGTIHEAVQKYGLKLEPRRAPMEMIVVDHLEKTPIEN